MKYNYVQCKVELIIEQGCKCNKQGTWVNKK